MLGAIPFYASWLRFAFKIPFKGKENDFLPPVRELLITHKKMLATSSKGKSRPIPIKDFLGQIYIDISNNLHLHSLQSRVSVIASVQVSLSRLAKRSFYQRDDDQNHANSDLTVKTL